MKKKFLLKKKFTTKRKNTSGGIRTRNPRIRSPMRYPVAPRRQRPWWDSNPQPLDPKSSALSIAPQGHVLFGTCRKTFVVKNFSWQQKRMENPGFDPGASTLLTSHSTD